MTENSDEAIAKDFEQLGKIGVACLRNAQDLIKSAKILLDKDVDHISYHLAALALEEIGKITLLRMKFGARAAGKTDTFATPILDDHIKKLFWALWGPMFGRTRSTKEEIDQWKGIATTIHNTRLRSLYVDPTAPLSPEQKVTHEEVTQLVSLAEARVGMQAEEGEQEFDEDTAALTAWFVDATDDPEKRNYIFASESMDKLAQLKNPRKWIEWLHERYMELEAQTRELMEREFSRQAPSGAEAEEKRWKIKIRLYSASHSIRHKALSRWNEISTHIFLYPTKRHDELICEFNLIKQLAMTDLWTGLWEVSRLFVLSLNVATQGFFWWYLPREVDSLYDEIVDLENDRKTLLQDTDKFRDCWHHLVLREDAVMPIRSIMVYILRSLGTEKEQPFFHYSLGLALLAKSDPQVRFYVNSFVEFFATLKVFLNVNGYWDGKEDLETAAQRAVVGEEEELTGIHDILQLGKDVEQGQRLDEVSSKKVIEMKSVCDTYFLVQTLKDLKGVDIADVLKERA